MPEYIVVTLSPLAWACFLAAAGLFGAWLYQLDKHRGRQ